MGSIAIFIFLLMHNFISGVESFCSLCPSNKIPIRIDCVVEKATGLTCGELFPQLLLNENERECLEYQEKYQQACCGENSDDLCETNIEQPKTQKGEIIDPGPGEIGDEPMCQLCYHQESFDMPGCSEYYARGLKGFIPSNVCGALQDFAKSACGCTSWEQEDESIRKLKGSTVLGICMIATATLVNYVVFLVRQRKVGLGAKASSFDWDLDI